MFMLYDDGLKSAPDEDSKGAGGPPDRSQPDRGGRCGGCETDLPPGPREEGPVALIVCYHKEYLLRSLDYIKALLAREDPARVIILNITDVKAFTQGVAAYLTPAEMDELQGHFNTDKEIRAGRYGLTISRLCREMDIPAEVIEVKGDPSRIILEAVDRYDPCCVVLHKKDETRLDKFFSGSIEDEVVGEERADRFHLLE